MYTAFAITVGLICLFVVIWFFYNLHRYQPERLRKDAIQQLEDAINKRGTL